MVDLGDADRRHPWSRSARSTPGCFSNDDALSEQLAAAGKATGEKVWRLPLTPGYDKLIDLAVSPT